MWESMFQPVFFSFLFPFSFVFVPSLLNAQMPFLARGEEEQKGNGKRKKEQVEGGGGEKGTTREHTRRYLTNFTLTRAHTATLSPATNKRVRDARRAEQKRMLARVFTRQNKDLVAPRD